MRIKTCLLSWTLLSATQLGWAGTSSAPLRISMTLLDRCDVMRPAADARALSTRCSAGVAKAVELASTAEQHVAKNDAAWTTQPLPKDRPTTGEDVVAVIF